MVARWLMLFLLIISTHALADFKLEITALNSPVSEANAKFKVIVPKDFTPKQINVRLASKDPKFKQWERDLALTQVSGREYSLLVPVGILPKAKFDLHAIVKAEEPPKGLLGKILNKLFATPKVAVGKTKFEVSGQIIVHGDPQPPHPGEAGEATLLGIDSDNDGVRDDVEIWINERLADQPADVVKAMKDLARADQLIVASIDDKETNIQRIHESLDRSNCVIFLIGLEAVRELNDEYSLKKINTKDRVIADLKSEENFHGQITTLKPRNQKHEYCLP